MNQKIVQNNEVSAEIGFQTQPLGGQQSSRAYELRRKIDPVLSVLIRRIDYRDAKSTYYEGDGHLELERADTGDRLELLMLSFRGDSSEFCFVGVVEGQIVTVVVDQSHDWQICRGEFIAKAYNWPDSASQTNLV